MTKNLISGDPLQARHSLVARVEDLEFEQERLDSRKSILFFHKSQDLKFQWPRCVQDFGLTQLTQSEISSYLSKIFINQ